MDPTLQELVATLTRGGLGNAAAETLVLYLASLQAQIAAKGKK